MREKRLDEMEQYILLNGSVSIDKLVKRFDISINTLRRDLSVLEDRGHIEKMYGGACARTLPTLLSSPERFGKNIAAKQRIGKLAESLVPGDTTVYIDSGSTVPSVIKHLGDRNNLTLITHSLVAINEASRIPSINLISIGGIYNNTLAAFVGMNTLKMLMPMSINIALMAASGVSLKHGLTNNTYFEAEIKRQVIECSSKIILMADRTKFSVNALMSYCPLAKLSAVVTDSRPDDEFMEFFQKKSIEVIY
ncbi:MAG: DeoR/GlpR family DNA-binding transcription regulator [Clostridia bacterium]|nr:DeoR/GlpR family DNA-binding transcription regulator [Clostridia bacterium]